MSDAATAKQLQDIQAKLDAIHAELEIARRQREEMQELRDDLTLIAKDAFQSAVVELEDIAPFVQTGDFLHLVKKILRNTNNINAAVSQLESTLDFIEDWRPIGKELFNDGLEKLDDLDRKGYFVFLKEIFTVLDNVVTHYSAEDVRILADNIVVILETVKGLTQPEMLDALNNALTVYQNLDTKDLEAYSVWRAIKELRSPEMKRGLGFIITFLKNISQEQLTPQHA
ncbi:MAG: DUF1641 domain-containing protein [Fidelibacterota bacterium]|nr:MAG: DUF1641 domain-containing protein [Candidatus Neomarinimicrobiota bacterium]